MKEININNKRMIGVSHLAPDSEKETFEFGLKVGHSIESEWWDRKQGACRFFDRLDQYDLLRAYARGQQPIGKYKDLLSHEGDLKYTNLDWTPVPIMPKFIDIVVNGMASREFTAKAEAIDAFSQDQKKRHQRAIKKQMVGKELLNIVKEATGFDPFATDPNNLPKTDEQLDLYMKMNYKPSVEIAEELAIDSVLKDNEYEDLRYLIDYDNVVVGKSVLHHSYYPGYGIELEYIDPKDHVHSWTTDKYYKDCYYHGHYKPVQISEIYKYDPTISKTELEDLEKSSASWFGDRQQQDRYSDNVSNGGTIPLLFFSWKTTKNLVFKRKTLSDGSYRYIRKKESFDPTPDMQDKGGFKKIVKTFEVWYDGIMVLGSNKMLSWKLQENMVRVGDQAQRAVSSYVVSSPKMGESLAARMIPFADLIQVTHLKLQTLTARMLPDGVFIDADGVNEVDLGNGATYNAAEALNLFFQTGSVVGRSYTSEGEYNQGKVPIKEIQHSASASKIQGMITSYNQYMGMLRDVTGLNESVDASSPDSRSLVGIQKMAALNSNTATRHILNAGLYTFRKTAEAISLRLADALATEEGYQHMVDKIGRYNTDIINDLKNISLHQFGLFIEVSPDIEEKEKMEARIQKALDKGDINLEDAIAIETVNNVKMQLQLLRHKREEMLAREERMKKEAEAMRHQANIQSQAMAAKAKAQQQQLEIAGKIKLDKQQTLGKIQVLNHEVKAKERLMKAEFELNKQLREIEISNQRKSEEYKESEKNSRVDKQSTQQSKMIEQRNTDGAAIDFESSNDTIGDFGLEAFDPK